MRNFFLLFIIISISGCKKKDDTPPGLQFKTGTGYTYSDLTVSHGSSFVVGIIANSGASDLQLFYTEVAYDGSNAPKLVSRIWLNASEANHYERDVTVTTRNQPGTERWVFDVNDADGRITKKEIRVTVQ